MDEDKSDLDCSKSIDISDNGESEVNIQETKEETSDDKSSESLDKKDCSDQKLWDAVHENPNDFNAWTVLLNYVDQEGDLELGRQVYDSFLTRYPYCYGYWKKYADFEKNKGTQESVLKTFGRGLEAIPLSVDLWLHYLEYVTWAYGEAQDYVREQYEMAVQTCGSEFRSDKLWETYINWESFGSNLINVTHIYDRLLTTPLSKYSQHWSRFQEHVKDHIPEEVLVMEELIKLQTNNSKSDSSNPAETPPGVEAEKNDSKETKENKSVLIKESDESLQKKMIESRKKIYEKTAEEVKLRWGFEEAIKRPYFHVKPLERSQLRAWRVYLDYEISLGDDRKIKILFERCLIACALYEEFWIKYVKYLEEHGATEEEIRNVYLRACTVHVRDKMRPHLLWAAFEEGSGDSDTALQILNDVQSRFENGVEAYMQAVGVHKRSGDTDEAEKLFISAVEKFQNKDDKSSYAHLAVKYARFLVMMRQDYPKAVDILQEAWKHKRNPNILLCIAENCIKCHPPRVKEAEEALRTGTESEFSSGTRLLFAHRYLHFITECGEEKFSMNVAYKLLYTVQKEVREQESLMSVEDDSKQDLSEDEQKKTEIEVATVNGTASEDVAQAYNYQDYDYAQAYAQYSAAAYQGWDLQSYAYNQQAWNAYNNYYSQS